jgi:hypothetical protein
VQWIQRKSRLQAHPAPPQDAKNEETRAINQHFDLPYFSLSFGGARALAWDSHLVTKVRNRQGTPFVPYDGHG